MGQAKICVKCPTETELYDIQAKAQAAGLVNYLVVSLVAFIHLAGLFNYLGMASRLVLPFRLYFESSICTELV